MDGTPVMVIEVALLVPERVAVLRTFMDTDPPDAIQSTGPDGAVPENPVKVPIKLPLALKLTEFGVPAPQITGNGAGNILTGAPLVGVIAEPLGTVEIVMDVPEELTT